jgi:hypothetical protein
MVGNRQSMQSLSTLVGRGSKLQLFEFDARIVHLTELADTLTNLETPQSVTGSVSVIVESLKILLRIS